MARRTHSQARLPLESPARGSPAARAATSSSRNVSAEPATGLVLRKSPARLKLDALEKEHERLLREIEKKKYSCEATEHTVRDAHDALHLGAEPLREALFSMLREIHEIFEQLLHPRSALSRSDRAALRRFHGHFIAGLPRPGAADGASDERAAEPSESGADGAPPSGDARAGSHGGAEHASAHKPSPKNTELLRALYRKLAVALHPDKARDASEAARLTSLMKEVTRAYANEDLAQLVELDRTWLAQTPAADDDELERRCDRVLAANGELRRQLRALTARLKQLKLSLPGLHWPRGRSRASGADLAAALLADLQREVDDIERLRDAARELKAGRIDVEEFLRGPRLAADEHADPLPDLFDQMLEELLRQAHESEWRAGGARRSRRRR